MAALPVLRIRQGESARLILPCINSNGTTINASNAIDIVVYLNLNGKTAAKFSLVDKQGYGVLTVPVGAEYFIEIQLTREQTQSMKPGGLVASVLIQTPDVSAAEGVAYSEISYQVAVIERGVVTKESF